MEAPKDDADDAQHRDNRHKDVHAALPSKLNPSTAATTAARFKKVSPAMVSLSLHSMPPPLALVQLARPRQGAFTQRHSSAKGPLPELKICRFECMCGPVEEVIAPSSSMSIATSMMVCPSGCTLSVPLFCPAAQRKRAGRCALLSSAGNASSRCLSQST